MSKKEVREASEVAAVNAEDLGMGEWREFLLGDMTRKIGSGATPRGGKEAYKGGGTALIRSQNIHNLKFSRDGLAYIDDTQAADLRNVIVEESDVLLNITGDSVARCSLVDPKVLPARVNQHVAIIRPLPTVLSAQFLQYVLVSPLMQEHLLALASAGATRNALTKSMLESLVLRIPPLPEQRAIAHILGTLDDKIELNRRMNETLEEMARALFQAWFVDFEPVRAKMEGRWKPGQSLPGLPVHLYDLFPDRLVDSELGEIPEGWEVRSVGDFASLNPESWSKKTRPVTIEYVDLSNAKRGRIIESVSYDAAQAPSRAQRVLRSGDTIVGLVRPANGSYAYVSQDELTGSTGFAVLRPSRLEHQEFVYLAATSPASIELLTALADGAAYPAVRSDDVASLEVIYGGEKTLEVFSGYARPIVRGIYESESSTAFLASLRDTLLPKLISGEVRVGDEVLREYAS